MKTINFTKEKLNKFKREHSKAREKGKEVFIFDGNEYLLNYATYLIEYLEDKFKCQNIKK